MKTKTMTNLLRSLILSIIVTITISTTTITANDVSAVPTNSPSVPVVPPVTTTTTTAAKEEYNTPAGILSLLPQIFNLNSFSAQESSYDDFDDYIPFRSDVHDHFSWALLKQVLHEEPKENVMFSPFSVKLALALLSEAAGNQTQTQLELVSTLTDIRMPDNVRGFYKKTLAALKKENPYYTLNLESKIYTDDFIEPQQRYASMLKSFYSTDIQRLHFADAHNSANAINDWCKNATNGRLQQLVTDDSVRSNVMLMANVIYFNGLWRRPFNDSFDGVFFRTENEQIKVTYMQQTEYFYNYDSIELNAKILRLPYKGKKFSMFILLPNTKGGIEELTHNLANYQVKGAQWMMEESKLKVTIPKFKFDYNKNLKETLQTLGIRNIFTNEASLPGLARGGDVAGKLKVSNIYQKSGIDVNEKGTEAYASTVIEIDNKFGGATIIEEFTVNRPFIFFIEEEATGNLIFAGKVLDPFV